MRGGAEEHAPRQRYYFYCNDCGWKGSIKIRHNTAGRGCPRDGPVTVHNTSGESAPTMEALIEMARAQGKYRCPLATPDDDSLGYDLEDLGDDLPGGDLGELTMGDEDDVLWDQGLVEAMQGDLPPGDLPRGDYEGVGSEEYELGPGDYMGLPALQLTPAEAAAWDSGR